MIEALLMANTAIETEAPNVMAGSQLIYPFAL